MNSKAFDGLAWGFFILLIGLGWYIESAYGLESSPYISLGVGVILLGLNVARLTSNIKISKFSLFIGLVALIMGTAGILGSTFELIPTIIILIGLFMIGEAASKLTRKSK
jgi:hypothetical protein